MAVLDFVWSLSTLDTLLIFFLTLCVVLFLRTWWESRSLPPGPWGLPFFGYSLFLGTQLHKTFHNVAKKYGNIFSVSMGSMLFVMVDGYDAIKEIFLKYPGETFHGKPKYFNFQGWLSDFQGVMDEDGAVWKEQRRFLLTTLRDFGFGRSTAADNIRLEVEKLIKIFQAKNKEPIDYPEILFASFSANVVSALVLGHRFEYDDPKFHRLRDAFDFRKVTRRIFMLMGAPWLRHFPIRSWFGMDILHNMKDSLQNFIRAEIQQHRETLDEDNPRDVIDVYLTEAKKNASDSWMTDGRLLSNIALLFNAGQFTVSLTLQWGFKLMMQYPEVQRKVQEELDVVVGQERFPNWNDRSNLPYCEATINEIHRFASPVAINVQHSTSEDVHLNGFTIPSGTIVLSNIYSSHYDPKYWKEPEKFDPKRFLTKECKLLKHEAFIPFSIGKRSCLGESLAKMELFLLFTILFQRFTFQPPEGVLLQDDTSNNGYIGSHPGDYTMCAIPRFKW